MYRQSLLDHLVTVTIRHWDPVMRKLGAQAIRKICQLDLWKLGQECIERVVCVCFSSNDLDSVLKLSLNMQTLYLAFADTSDIHGALLTLTELSLAYRSADPKDRVEFKLREVGVAMRVYLIHY